MENSRSGLREPLDLGALRRDAEARVQSRRGTLRDLSQAEVGELVHELDTHQIELEIQNEELRRSQEELSLSQRRYADLYEHAPTGYLTLSDKGLIAEANLRACEMLHNDRSRLLHQPLSKQISEEDQDAWYRHLRSVVASDMRQRFEARLRRSGADELWCLVESLHRRDPISGESHIRTTLTDITERRQAEAALEAALTNSETQRRGIDAMYGAAQSVLAATDFTSAASALCGQAKRAIGARAGFAALATRDEGCHEVVSVDCGGEPLALETAQPMLLRGLHTGVFDRGEAVVVNDFRTSEWVHRMPAGHVEVTNLLLAPIVCDGNVVGALGIANKPGGFSETDRSLAVGFAQLAAIAWQRSEGHRREQELAHQLHQSQKLEAIGQLAGGVAHDINNVMTAIMGCASLALAAAVPNSVQAQDLQSILDSCLRARDLTGNLLGFARQGRYDPRLVSVETVITDVTSLLERTIPKTVEVRLQLQPPVPAVEADKSQLQAALLNVCNNAVDAMAGAAGVLAITVGSVDARDGELGANLSAGRYLLIEIRDTGVGMDRDTLARATDPFFTTKPKGRGTGLGLSMAHGTVSNHGGALELRSEPGRGTTVRVYLPAAQGYAAEAPEEPAAAKSKVGEGTVLLVDDEPVIVSAGKRVLEDLGYTVLTAADGHEALDIYRATRDRVALVVLDLNMPRLSGVETFKALREMDPDVRVLIATGYEVESKAAALMADGACGLLQKPFEPSSLAAEVHRLASEKLAGRP